MFDPLKPSRISSELLRIAIIIGLSLLASCPVSAQSPSLSGFAVSPTTAIGGSDVKGAVSIASPQRVDTVVKLSSTSGAAFPASSTGGPISTITIPAGQTSVSFLIKTIPVERDTSVGFSAAAGSTVSTKMIVQAPDITGVKLSAPQVFGSLMAGGTVTLNGPAPAGFAISFSSDNAAATPSRTSSSFTAGSRTAEFRVETIAVAATVTANITATTASGRKSTQLLILPPSVIAFALSSASVAGGQAATGLVILNYSAPASGFNVSLSSSATQAASVPASVTVPAGQTKATFNVSTSQVSADTPVTITAGSRSAYLTVTAPPTP